MYISLLKSSGRGWVCLWRAHPQFQQPCQNITTTDQHKFSPPGALQHPDPNTRLLLTRETFERLWQPIEGEFTDYQNHLMETQFRCRFGT